MFADQFIHKNLFRPVRYNLGYFLQYSIWLKKHDVIKQKCYAPQIIEQALLE